MVSYSFIRDYMRLQTVTIQREIMFDNIFKLELKETSIYFRGAQVVKDKIDPK